MFWRADVHDRTKEYQRGYSLRRAKPRASYENSLCSQGGRDVTVTAGRSTGVSSWVQTLVSSSSPRPSSSSRLLWGASEALKWKETTREKDGKRLLVLAFLPANPDTRGLRDLWCSGALTPRLCSRTPRPRSANPGVGLAPHLFLPTACLHDHGSAGELQRVGGVSREEGHGRVESMEEEEK